MTDNDALLESLREGKRRFMDLVADIRPELHRYCARMTGSVADGEDIVQDTLARAYYALSESESVGQLRPWLFKIAHRRAIDHLRRYERRYGTTLDEEAEVSEMTLTPEDRLAAEEATRLAIRRFCELPPAQRSVVVMKDVLGHSAEEIADVLGLTEAAVKSALHRGRERLRVLATVLPPGDATGAARQVSPLVARYAALFNARDWDAVRTLLADEVRLDLVSRAQRSGRREVSSYFTNYAKVTDWRLVPAWVDGREALAIFTSAADVRPSYFVELVARDGLITAIRDFRYVPYIGRDLQFEPA